MYMLHSHPTYLSVIAAMLGAFLILAPVEADAQERDRELPRLSPSAATSQVIGVTEVMITYGRPAVRERTIFGELVPYGEVWRTGADEATTISFSDDVEIEGEHVEEGIYALFTIPGEDEWSIILNEQPEQWGAYQYDEDGDVLNVSATPEPAEHQERLTFYFEDIDRTSGTLVLHWADVRVPIDLRVDTDAVLSERAEEAIEQEEWDALHGYAAHALQQEVMMDEARDWVQAWVAEEETFANLALKARILAWHGDYQAASDVVDRAIAAGEVEEASPDQLEELEQEAQEWH